MKKTSTIKKAQMGASTPALPSIGRKIKSVMNSAKTSKPKRSTLPNKFKKPVYEGYTLPEYTVTAPKSKNGSKIAAKKMVAKKMIGKKPIKKAQEGVKMVVDGKEYESGAMLPEAVVTGKPIKSLKDRVKSVKDKVESVGDALGLNRTYKPKPAKRSVHTVKYYRQHGKGKGSGMRNLIQRFNKGYYQ